MLRTRMTYVLATAFAISFVPAATLKAEPETKPDASAASSHDHHAGHQQTGELSEASKALEAAMQKMHKDMSLPYTNDIDVDFVRGMIPHHQGAIDQAEIFLKYSKNPRLRRLAGGIIAAQKREIRFMVKWLKENADGVETSEMPKWLKNNPTTVEAAQKAGGPEND